MRRGLLLPSTAVTCTVLLAACGTNAGGARGSALPADLPAPACGTSVPPGSPGPSAAPPPPGGSAPTPAAPSGQSLDGVTLSTAGGCPVFEVANPEKQPMTYTVTFTWTSGSGAATATAKQTVAAVRPGRTVRRPVVGDGRATGASGPGDVRIVLVRSVPTDEAPSSGGPCPASGLHVYADEGDAAMGLRAIGLHLVNCGSGVYRLDGYPAVQVLDERHAAVRAVRVLHGGGAIATGTGADGAPRPLALAPGQGAEAVLVWRNTTQQGSDPVDAPYVRVVARPGAAAVMVTPELDLGTTGKLAVGPWKSVAAPAG